MEFSKRAECVAVSVRRAVIVSEEVTILGRSTATICPKITSLFRGTHVRIRSDVCARNMVLLSIRVGAQEQLVLDWMEETERYLPSWIFGIVSEELLSAEALLETDKPAIETDWANSAKPIFFRWMNDTKDPVKFRFSMLGWTNA